MVHMAPGFAKMSNRLRTMACTTSIDLGAAGRIRNSKRPCQGPAETGTPVAKAECKAGRNSARLVNVSVLKQNKKLRHSIRAADTFFALVLRGLLLKERLLACQARQS